MAGVFQRQRGQVVNVLLGLVCPFEDVVSLANFKNSEHYSPVAMQNSPSSLTLIHWLASSKPKSCTSSMRFCHSTSFFSDRFRFFTTQSGNDRVVLAPATVYTDIPLFWTTFMVNGGVSWECKRMRSGRLKGLRCGFGSSLLNFFVQLCNVVRA